MKKYLSYLAFGLVFNTAIGSVLSLFEDKISLWQNIIFSQCVGLTIMTISLALVSCVKTLTQKILVMVVSLPISVWLGNTLGYAAIGMGFWRGPEVWESAVVGLFFGCIGSLLFLLSERIEAEIKQRKLIQSESDRRETEAHLKLLQAQIEPHFLFNTLANVSSLIDSDPGLAKTLLDRLDDWLRVALARARSHRTSLGDELDMLENYLEIMKIRFGDRLRWCIDGSDEARLSEFPPMLLQPLVENAVRHGIEPKLGGGKISIQFRIEQAILHISVGDNGMGLSNHSESSGTGLANVRARLECLFGEAGSFSLQTNEQGGATATLSLPHKALLT